MKIVAVGGNKCSWVLATTGMPIYQYTGMPDAGVIWFLQSSPAIKSKCNSNNITCLLAPVTGLTSSRYLVLGGRQLGYQEVS